ncbi:hypothetical protein LJR225_000397 [Phenylobacterium sp. LjRoot225]|uniref:hypothetical protein n=1 Tax=Phenylobacterium sp. LjRoot225 TaxID=3342285 RepID=UPI003ECFB539
MKSLHLAFLATAAVSVAGCNRPADATLRTALDCPPSQGDLTRTGLSADRRTCTYVSAKGDQVSLRLLPVSTTPDAALRPVEAELRSLIPPTTLPRAARAASGGGNEAGDSDEGDGHQARVSLPGIHINAQGDKAEVKIGSLHVDAHDGGAVVRESHDVRLRGQALAFKRRGYRALYIVARGDLPGGMTSVGYEAGGPRKGPLAVAVVRMKSHGDDIYRDVRRLVRRNAGI